MQRNKQDKIKHDRRLKSPDYEDKVIIKEDKCEKSKRKISVAAIVLYVLSGIILAVAGTGYLYLQSTKNYNKDNMFVVDESPLTSEGNTDSSTNDTDSSEQSLVDTGLELPDNSVYYDGEIYLYNEDLINILFIGVDETDNGRYIKQGLITGGHADVLILASINAATNTTNVISIPRDSITEIKLMDIDYSRVVNTIESQITTAYAYGDGEELSAELTCDAVSGLLYSIPINRYYAMNMNAVIDLTDAVGGVTLEVLQDFNPYARYSSIMTKQQEYSMDLHKLKKGNVVTLNGPEACVYVKTRNTDIDNSDLENRRPRQVQFIRAFIDTVKEQMKTNIKLPFDLLKLIEEHSIYNIETNEFSYLFQTVLSDEFSSNEVITVPGEVEVTEEETFYWVDATDTKEMVLDLFYTKMENEQ